MITYATVLGFILGMALGAVVMVLVYHGMGVRL